jgi:hypothetical protein
VVSGRGVRLMHDEYWDLLEILIPLPREEADGLE